MSFIYALIEISCILPQHELSMCPFNMKISFRLIMHGLILSHFVSTAKLKRRRISSVLFGSIVPQYSVNTFTYLLFTINKKAEAFGLLGRVIASIHLAQ